ncbi:ArgE/DapE family deacylase [Microbacterium sp. RD1]|uniref:ArgE/DapE family deacylase n=1 Tax=Microbacterium sp. RD1 TaxID=3457313 RepID=UPI003FA545BB
MSSSRKQHSAPAARVLDVLARSRDAITESALELLSVPSVNPNYPGAHYDTYIGNESEANALIRDRFAAVFDEYSTPATSAQRENFAGRVRGRGRGRSLILNGHIDVVPPGDPENWSREPFTPVVEDGRVYARGASDMKTGVIAALWATRALQEAGVRLDGDLIVQSVAGEELGEHDVGTSCVLAAGYGADAAIILEPSASFDRPLNINPTAAGALWARIRVEGLAGHPGLRRELVRAGGAGEAAGVNAIDKGYLVLQALYQLEQDWGFQKKAPFFPTGHFSIMPGIIHGQGRDVNIPFIFAEYCEIDILVWYPPLVDPAEVRREIEEYVRAFVARDSWLGRRPPRFEWLLDFPGYHTPADHPIVRALSDAHERAVGSAAHIEAFPAACDATWVEQTGIPVVNYGPGHLANAHKADEWCAVQEIHDAAAALALTAMQWCGLSTEEFD